MVLLFEELLGLQTDILKKFGLPSMEKYCRYLWSITDLKLNDKLISKKIKELEQYAKDYLSSESCSPVDLLSMAVAEGRAYGDVLPELGFPEHEYFIFVYNDFLLTGKASPESVFKEFNIIRENNLFEQINKLCDSSTGKSDESLEDIKHEDLKFLEAFILHKFNESLDPSQGNDDFYTAENNMEVHLFQAAVKYKKFLALCDSGIDEPIARHEIGLDDETFFNIAYFSYMELFQ